MSEIKHFKTIVISDVHLGTSGSKAKEIVEFLKMNTCDKLILNGDIIDGWQLKRFGVWKKNHTRFFKRILQMIEHYKTEVIYLRGNHDDFLDQIIPFKIANISIQRDYIHTSHGKNFYVVHGDVFDSVTTNLRWVAKLGDIGYTFLLWLNRQYNHYRRRRGMPYYSLSQKIKAKVKTAVSYIDNFETQLTELAKIKGCDGIICGHIHQPSIRRFDDISYMNSGDWVESMSALGEDFHGNWEILYTQDLGEEEDESSLDFLEDNDAFKDILLLKEQMKIKNISR